jgi:hypothetical protein
MVEGQQSPADGRGGAEWVGGWVAFAAIMMIILGALHATFGFVAILDDHWVGWTNRGHTLLSISAWGWVQLAMGVLVLVAGFGIVLGRPGARVVGLLFASLSLIDGLFVISLYPWWAVIIIGIDVLLIWALTVHWREVSRSVLSDALHHRDDVTPL